MADSDATGAPEPAPPEPFEVHGCPAVVSRGDTVVFADRAGYLPLVRALADEGYAMCHDVTAVDYLTHPGRALPPGVEAERFELVVSLQDIVRRRRIRVRVQVPEADPVVPSLFDLWPGSEAPEREVYDLFGIAFDGHPDLTRILMPEDWLGHPLRKDYEVGHIPVQFKAAPERR